MIRKYFIRSTDEQVVLALKFHPRWRLVTIGGHGSMLPDARYIAKNYFGCEEDWKETWTQKNKARISFVVESEVYFDKCVAEIDDVGFSIQSVKAHGRIMR